MSEGLNKVMLLGGLTADPELRVTQGGQAVLKLRIATTESYLDRDKQRQERVEYHSVTVWGRRGEALAKILRKGSAVFIEGSLRTTSYDDRDGNKKWKTEVVASNVILAGGRKQAAEHADDEPEPQPAREPRDVAPRGDDATPFDGDDDGPPF